MSVINETLKKIKREPTADADNPKPQKGKGVSGVVLFTVLGLVAGVMIFSLSMSLQKEKKLRQEAEEELSSKSEALVEKDTELAEAKQEKKVLEDELQSKITGLDSELQSSKENQSSLEVKIKSLEEELAEKDQSIIDLQRKIQELEPAKTGSLSPAKSNS